MAKLHIWHRYVGVTSALLVIILSVTGLILNFNDQLNLDNTHISSEWLLKHYNVGTYSVSSFSTESHTVSHASQFLYLDGTHTLNVRDNIVGAIEVDDLIVIATSANLLVLDTEGELVDEIGVLSGLPETPLGIAKTPEGNPVLRGVNTYWKGTKELFDWEPLDGPHPQWVAQIDTPENINNLVQAHARSNEINFERVLLDLHSGRLLGSWGQNIMSLAAILLLFLSISGLIIWLRKKPSQSQRS